MSAEGCFADSDHEFINQIVVLCQNIVYWINCAFPLKHWKALETILTTLNQMTYMQR